MAHQVIDIGEYHEGDALTINIPLLDSDNNPISSSTDWQAEFLIKDTETQDDANALLTKTKSGGGISFTANTQDDVDNVADLDTADGDKAVVSIATGDTDGFLGADLAQDTFHYRLRVTNSAGDRMTVVHGDFVIYV